MRILVVSPQLPHAEANSGGAVYLGIVVEALARQDDVDVACVCYRHEEDRQPFDGVRWYTVERRFNRDLSGFQLRRQQLRNAWRWGALGLPLEVAKARSPAFQRALEAAIAKHRPDVAMVEFSVMAWCLEPLRAAGIRTVFTDHEQGASPARQLGPGSFGAKRDQRLWKRYVHRYYPMADLCQALTEADAVSLEAAIERPVHLRETLMPIPDAAVDPRGAGPVMLFFGNYLHHPNPEAAVAIATEVLPRVREQLPDAELWLAGAQADARVTALGDRPGVRFLGFVDDLHAVIAKARCLVAPVYSGSGVRTKSLFAMAHGLPIVANQLGLQGMEAPAASYESGEQPAELAAACLRFLEDPDHAAQAGEAAREFVISRFDADEVARQQIERIRTLV